MNGLDFYLFQRDEKGNATFSAHRVWDKEKFIRAKMNEAAKLNATHNTGRAVALQITAEAYRERIAPL